jgi:hypothetical protein
LLSSSPWHIAANHVLHRLLAPRHPPPALYSLTKIRPRAGSDGRIRHCQSAVHIGPGKLFDCQRPNLSPACLGLAAPKGRSNRGRRSAARVSGGADRDRTDDLRLAKPALSQLSYSPRKVVGLGRLELPTSRLSGGRSNRAELQARKLEPPPERNRGFERIRCVGPRKTNSVRR